jgi:hypothetical protein
MNPQIRNLKYLIEEYEELCQNLEQMSDDWENGSPEDAAMSDPSDQYLKGEEASRKYDEIKNVLKEL